MTYRWSRKNGTAGIPYVSGSGAAMLAPGTNGHVLTLSGGQPTWASAAGGSDPWTTVVLGSPFSTTNATNTNTTGLSFTPAVSTTYLVEVYLLLRTATATIGPRPGFAWPSSLTDGGAWMQAPNSATASAQRWWGPLSTQNAASTGVPDTTNSHLAIGGAVLVCGPSTSGSFQLTLAAETAGTSVTCRAGSFLRYRTIS